MNKSITYKHLAIALAIIVAVLLVRQGYNTVTAWHEGYMEMAAEEGRYPIVCGNYHFNTIGKYTFKISDEIICRDRNDTDYNLGIYKKQ